MDIWTGVSDARFLVPVFSDVRINLMDKIISPYISLDVGYTFVLTSWDTEAEPVPGLYFNPVSGIEYEFIGGNAFIIGVGYFLQRIDLPYTGGVYSAISLNIGFIF